MDSPKNRLGLPLLSGGKHTPFLILVLAAFAVWRPDNAFFWRDEWDFLLGFRDEGAGYFLRNHYGHVFPVFKLLYFLELRSFGTNAILFAYLHIVLFASVNYAVFLLVRSISNTTAAWSVALAITLHPLMFNDLGWTFQQCITLHMLFQVIAVGLFLHWAMRREGAGLMPPLLFCILQQYSFGNGYFIPVLFIAGAFLFRNGSERWRAIAPFALLFIVSILLQASFGGARQQGIFHPGMIPSIVRGWVLFLEGTLSSILFVRMNALGTLTPWVTTAVSIVVLVLAWTNPERDRRMALFLMIWVVTTTCSIPIVVQDNAPVALMPFYYFVLPIVPVIVLVQHAVAGRWRLAPTTQRVAIAATLPLVIAVFLVDQQAKDIFSYRNLRNQEDMLRALQNDTPYQGYDDPYFWDEDRRMGDPRDLYTYWRDRDLFHIPTPADRAVPPNGTP